jgi:hypothetical protein
MNKGKLIKTVSFEVFVMVSSESTCTTHVVQHSVVGEALVYKQYTIEAG